MSIAKKAHQFAATAHASIGQKRKYTGEDYIVHPSEVAQIVSEVPGATEEMIAAAFLHDVVEDTGVSIETIRSEFGEEVAKLVSDLTDVSKKSDGNRRTRKAIDLEHTRQADPRAKTIKLADLISNTKSIVQYDPDFARVYLAEKKVLLQVLKDADSSLYQRAQSLLEESLKELRKRK